MKRRHYTLDEVLSATEFMQLAALQAMTRFKRRSKEDHFVFQGGTALHLAHGSLRHSVDLDFVASSSEFAESLVADIKRSVSEVALAEYGDCAIEFKAHPANGNFRNPQLYDIRLRRPGYLETIMVKLEFFVPRPGTISGYEWESLSPTKTWGNHRLSVHSQIPTATLYSIFTDKIFALGERKVLKYRDIIDLNFCIEQLGRRGEQIDSPKYFERAKSDFVNNAAMYGSDIGKMFETATKRLSQLDARECAEELCKHAPEALREMFNEQTCRRIIDNVKKHADLVIANLQTQALSYESNDMGGP